MRISAYRVCYKYSPEKVTSIDFNSKSSSSSPNHGNCGYLWFDKEYKDWHLTGTLNGKSINDYCCPSCALKIIKEGMLLFEDESGLKFYDKDNISPQLDCGWGCSPFKSNILRLRLPSDEPEWFKGILKSYKEEEGIEFKNELEYVQYRGRKVKHGHLAHHLNAPTKLTDKCKFCT